MIVERNARSYCSEDISLIENYAKAVADECEMWEIHHRRETDEGLSVRELRKRKEYFHRPASELIFLKHDIHRRLHSLNLSDETRKKMSLAHSGENHHFFGKHHSAKSRKKMSKALSGEKHPLFGRHRPIETKKKLSEALSGRTFSEETKKKMSEAQLGKHWYNNGVKSVHARSCPPGFVKGRLHLSRHKSSL